ncbi:adenylyltransferase/cytidyltransferase family protein [Endozoicomonas ascidiicola]|uniref:adenylyltransferase/cytidyltransferase family protein n=1 Tax=Endozoicomonas ascidiicola TaxID=1698521 RepID=UPI000B1BEEAD|nr:adenylyltransferase/cytidyltransferase family protein [Endozoicomonas ascidiicola]
MVIGYTTGVFDMFHVGHLNILRNAKENCDYLIVGISTDELVYTHKNVNLVVPFEDRRAIVSALKFVDETVPQSSYNKMDAWNDYKFNRMFVGSDWKGTPQWLTYEDAFSKLGVEVVYFDYTRDISSSRLRKVVEENYRKIGRP